MVGYFIEYVNYFTRYNKLWPCRLTVNTTERKTQLHNLDYLQYVSFSIARSGSHHMSSFYEKAQTMQRQFFWGVQVITLSDCHKLTPCHTKKTRDSSNKATELTDMIQ